MRPRTRLVLVGGRAELRRAPIDEFVFLLSEFQGLVVELGRSFAGPDVPDDVVHRSCRVEIVGLSYGSLMPDRARPNFGGVLLDDAGHIWSIRFRQDDTDQARRLWKHKVQLTGTALYSNEDVVKDLR